MTTATPAPDPQRRQTINTRRRIIVAVILLLLITISLNLVARSAGTASPDELSGSILLWHSLSDNAAGTLEVVLAEFEELNPRTTVHQQPFASQEELLEQYRETVETGLGPDVILGDAVWITELAQQGSIRSVESVIEPGLMDNYLPAAVDSLTDDDALYGLPLSLRVPALYYNTKLVDVPPESLDALLTQAAEGHTVLMSTDFGDALWGVQAFGGKFFDEDGRVILDQGGYANWLDWLMTARTAPGMILDGNRESLQQRFLQGDVSYYVGYPDELDTLIDGLGMDNLGVATLPSGPTGSAGPVLGVDALLFSPVSSANQQDVSVALGEFVTNAEQSATFMRGARMVRADTRMRINPRLHPLLAGFLTQAHSAISLPNLDTKDTILAFAANAYSRALNGLSSPLEAASETTTVINELHGFEAAPQAEAVCTYLGTVRLVHDWEGADAEALEAIVQRFGSICPLVIIKPEYMDLDAVRSNWKRNPTAATNPDLILASQEWMIDALQDGITLNDISSEIPSNTLQRYLPAAVAGMKQGIQLHGLPVSVRVHVLFYNKELVDDPAPVLDRLRLQADDGLPITLDAQFARGYWGVGAFGGRLLDAENLPALDEGGFADWLTWLRQSRDVHGVNLVYDAVEAKNSFLEGSSAYYVGEPVERAELASGLGEDNLGIALLPAGPKGDATPLFVASGLLFNGSLSESDLAAALGFALFTTNAENQLLLVESTERVPANATVDPSGQPHILTYLDQARTAYAIPNHTQIRDILEIGDSAYTAVLVDGVEPEQAAADITLQMNVLYGIGSGDVPVTPAGAAKSADPTDIEPATESLPAESVSETGPASNDEAKEDDAEGAEAEHQSDSTDEDQADPPVDQSEDRVESEQE